MNKKLGLLFPLLLGLGGTGCLAQRISAGYTHSLALDDSFENQPGFTVALRGYEVFTDDDESDITSVCKSSTHRLKCESDAKKVLGSERDPQGSSELDLNASLGKHYLVDFGFNVGSGYYSHDANFTLEGVLGLLRMGVGEEGDTMWTPGLGIRCELYPVFMQATAKAYVGRDGKDGFGMLFTAGGSY